MRPGGQRPSRGKRSNRRTSVPDGNGSFDPFLEPVGRHREAGADSSLGHCRIESTTITSEPDAAPPLNPEKHRGGGAEATAHLAAYSLERGVFAIGRLAHFQDVQDVAENETAAVAPARQAVVNWNKQLEGTEPCRRDTPGNDPRRSGVRRQQLGNQIPSEAKNRRKVSRPNSL
jgi:hypothetical protein